MVWEEVRKIEGLSQHHCSSHPVGVAGISGLLLFIINKLCLGWKTCQTHSALTLRVYKHLLSNSDYNTNKRMFFQIWSANMDS